MATPLTAIGPGCFRHKCGEIAVCPHCGYDVAAPRSPLLLPVLTRLNQRYLVGPTLGKPGGFGMTYLGFDVTLRVSVAIKEHCPWESADSCRSSPKLSEFLLNQRPLNLN